MCWEKVKAACCCVAWLASDQPEVKNQQSHRHGHQVATAASEVVYRGENYVPPAIALHRNPDEDNSGDEEDAFCISQQSGRTPLTKENLDLLSPFVFLGGVNTQRNQEERKKRQVSAWIDAAVHSRSNMSPQDLHTSLINQNNALVASECGGEHNRCPVLPPLPALPPQQRAISRIMPRQIQSSARLNGDPQAVLPDQGAQQGARFDHRSQETLPDQALLDQGSPCDTRPHQNSAEQSPDQGSVTEFYVGSITHQHRLSSRTFRQ